jgi:hypothetical protein
MYKLVKIQDGGTGVVLRIADSAAIPLEPMNTDYQQYLAWLAEGNTPEPAEETN